MDASAVPVSVDGRTLRLSNMGKVLYPGSGFTKADVIHYYVGVADALLPLLAGRPVTLRRYPDGVDGEGFYEKNAPRHAPEWVPTVRIATPGSSRGSESADHVLIEDRPTLVWVANLAGLELHVPQWRIDGDGGRGLPDLLVFDLDPGPGTDLVDCCRVARSLRAELAADGLRSWPKTSGSKGMQLYASIQVDDPKAPSRYAKTLAERLSKAHPDLIVSSMAKAVRRGKVLIDWSQNNPAKTTVAGYSLRARPRPTASAPVSWSEVENCERAEDISFTAVEVRDRFVADGDLFAGLHSDPRPLPR